MQIGWIKNSFLCRNHGAVIISRDIMMPKLSDASLIILVFLLIISNLRFIIQAQDVEGFGFRNLLSLDLVIITWWLCLNSSLIMNFFSHMITLIMIGQFVKVSDPVRMVALWIYIQISLSLVSVLVIFRHFMIGFKND